MKNMIYKIYKLISPSGGIYIGQTKNIKIRFYQHKSESKRRNHKIHAAIRKYGWDNFKTEILFDKIAEDIVDDLETYLIYNYRITGLNVSFDLFFCLFPPESKL
jgi:group I intron endonuclease